MAQSATVRSTIFALLCFWPLPGFCAGASDDITLSQAIETARGNNPDLKKTALSANSKAWEKLTALSEHLPRLSLSGTHFFDAKYSKLGVVFGENAMQFPTAFPQTEFEAEASILLFDGLGAINRYRAASLDAEASELELSHQRFLLDEIVQTRFYQALAAQELAKVAVQNIETLEQHLKLAKASERAGLSTNIDVLRIESQLEEARAEKILADDNIVTAKRILAEAMGIEYQDHPLRGSLPLPNRRMIPENLSLDVSQREDLQAQARREQAQDRLSSAASGAFFPKISLFGVEQFYKFGNFDPAILPDSSFQNAYSFGLRLSWNIFDGGASIAHQAQANDAAKIAAESSRKLQLASPDEFDIWKRKYVYNSALFEARKRSVEKSTESVRLATIAVRAGTKTHSEALDAELELFHARAGVIRAQMNAAEALSKLELAIGHRL